MAKEANQELVLVSIEELKNTTNVTEVVFQGMKAANNWKSGKMVSLEEFTVAQAQFLKSPIHGKGVKK